MIEVDGYHDLRRIGQGGLGDVYRATRMSTGSTVAIKVLRDVSDESVAWHRTRRELTALVALAGHANVIQLLELLDLAEGPALVMEFAPGGSVADLMRRRDAALTVGETVLVGRHITAALTAAHEQGIVHRDIKPQNLLIDAYGQVKLCDFGVAALTRSDEFQTRTNALSMRYASPEDLDNDVDVGPPSDVYSLGATLLHLARGAPPTLKERLAPWQAPDTDDLELAALDGVIAACLHPVPAERPTAAELHDRLEQLDWTLGERQRALLVDVAALPEVAPAGDRPGSVAAEQLPPPAIAPPPSTAEASADRLAPADHGSDATVSRGGPRPQRPSAEPPERRRRRRLLPLSIVAVGLVAAALAIWAVSDRSDDQADATDTTDTADTTVPATDPSTAVEPATAPTPTIDVQPRPEGLADIDAAGLVWPFGDPGECLVQTEADELESVACDQPHDLQRYLVAELDAAAFPETADFDADSVRAAVDTACRAAFEPFVGIAFDASELDAPFTLPSEATWEAGDRRYQCLVGSPGRRLVGDAAGSRR